MNTAAYLMAFALAATPYLAYLAGMIFFGIGAQRAAASKNDGRRVAWPLAVLSVLAFGLAVWQQSRLSTLFGSWPHNLGIESKTVLGVSIPLELGSGMFAFVGSAFWTLVLLALIGTGVAALFRPPPSKVLPGWASRVILVVLMGVLAATGWPEFVSALEGWQTLF